MDICNGLFMLGQQVKRQNTNAQKFDPNLKGQKLRVNNSFTLLLIIFTPIDTDLSQVIIILALRGSDPQWLL